MSPRIAANLLIFLLAPAVVTADSWNARLLDFETTEYFADVEIVGSTAICATLYGLITCDISNPESPQLIHKMLLDDGPTQMEVVGDRLFVAADLAGFLIFDVSNPQFPRLIHSRPDLAPVNTVNASDSLVAVFRPGNNNMPPRLLLTVDPNGETEVVFTDFPMNIDNGVFHRGYYYMFRHGPMWILDARNPLQVEFIDEQPETTRVLSGIVKGDYLFANTGIFDVSTPEEPRLIRHFQTRYSFVPHGVLAVSDTRLVVRGALDGTRLFIFDNRNPALVVLRGSPLAHDEAFGRSALSGNFLFASRYGWPNDLFCFDISRPSEPEEVWRYSNWGRYEEVVCDRDLIYARVSNRVQIIRRVGNSMEVMDTLRFYNPEKIAASSGVLYVYHQDEDYRQFISIYSVQNPEAPDSMTTIEYRGPEFDIQAKDSLLYVILNNAYEDYPHIEIFDCSNPAEPRSIHRSFQFQGRGNQDARIDGERMLVKFRPTRENADNPSLYLFDISQPDTLIRLGQLRLEVLNIGEFTFHNDVGYFRLTEEGIAIFDFTDPNNAREVNRIEVPNLSIYGLSAKEGLLVVPRGYGGCDIYSLEEDPVRPTKVGYFDNPGYVNNIDVQGEELFVSVDCALLRYDISQVRGAWFFRTDRDTVVFGEVIVGRPEFEVLELTNLSEELKVLDEITVNGEDFFCASEVPFELFPGESVDLEFEFSPRSAGEKSGQVQITTGDRSCFVELVGAGVAEDAVLQEDSPELIEFGFRSVSPNPFNSKLSVRFGIGLEAQPTRLAVYDLSGREVAILLDSKSGIRNQKSEIVWNAEDIPTGIYFVRLQQGAQFSSKKVVLLR